MADAAAPKRLLLDNPVANRIAWTLAIAAALSPLLAWQLVLAPEKRLVAQRVAAQQAMFKLFDLEKAYGKARGRYASDLDSLLASSPQGAALRSELTSRVDLSTLVVKGGPRRFRLEANILDPERTLIKLKGP